MLVRFAVRLVQFVEGSQLNRPHLSTPVQRESILKLFTQLAVASRRGLYNHSPFLPAFGLPEIPPVFLPALALSPAWKVPCTTSIYDDNENGPGCPRPFGRFV